MALTTDSLVLYWGPDMDFSHWGDPVLEDCHYTGPRWDNIPEFVSAQFRDAVSLDDGETEGYYTTPVRSVGALSDWGPGQVVLRSTGGTGVYYQVTDGTDWYYWTGSAWALVSDPSHWSTYTTLYAALPSFTGRSLGFKFKLTRTLSTDDSPLLGGVRVVTRLLFANTEGDETRASSFLDDVLHRILVVRFKEEVVVPGAEEFTVNGETVLDYSTGVNEFTHQVQGVEAVYDVSDDPNLTTPLTGTWVGGSTKTWTPTTPFTDGHVVHVRFQFIPDVVHTGNRDNFTFKLPALHVEGHRVVSRRSQWDAHQVDDHLTQDSRVVEGFDEEDYEIDCRIIAQQATDRERIMRSVRKYLGRAGIVEVSPSTSEPVAIALLDDDAMGASEGDALDKRFTLLVRFSNWIGREVAGYHVTSGNVEVTT